jgi:hypothetical protein
MRRGRLASRLPTIAVSCTRLIFRITKRLTASPRQIKKRKSAGRPRRGTADRDNVAVLQAPIDEANHQHDAWRP